MNADELNALVDRLAEPVARRVMDLRAAEPTYFTTSTSTTRPAAASAGATCRPTANAPGTCGSANVSARPRPIPSRTTGVGGTPGTPFAPPPMFQPRNQFRSSQEEMASLFNLSRGQRRDRGQRRGPPTRRSQSRSPLSRPSGRSIDVVLLPKPDMTSTVRGERRLDLCQQGLVLDKLFISKAWRSEEVIHQLNTAFSEHLEGGSISFQILKAVGQTLIAPRLGPGESLDGDHLCQIFGQKTMYLRPEREICTEGEDEELSPSHTATAVPSGLCPSSGPLHEPTAIPLGPGPSTLYGSSPPSAANTLGLRPSTSSGLSQQSSFREIGPTGPSLPCPVCTYINQDDTAVWCEMCESRIKNESNAGNRREPPSVIIHNFLALVDFENKPIQRVHVERETLFSDNVAFFKRKTSDPKAGPIRIHFRGEEGVDAGGLSRENFRILFRQLKSSSNSLVETTHNGQLLPANNQFHLCAGLFHVVGKVIGTALLNKLPVEFPLHNAVLALILGHTSDTVYSLLDIDGVIDITLTGLINEMLEETDADAYKELLARESRTNTYIDSCGWPTGKPFVIEDKHDLALCLMHHCIIGMRRDSILQLQEGLLSSLPDIRNTDVKEMAKLLSKTPITAEELREIEQEELADLQMSSASREVQTAEFVCKFFSEMDDATAQLTMIFGTGDATGRSPIQLKINNTQELSPLANTCDRSITFPKGHATYHNFQETVVERMRQTGDHFGMF